MIFYVVFFFNDTATTEIYTLSLHDALPISVNFDNINLKQTKRFKHWYAGKFRMLNEINH